MMACLFIMADLVLLLLSLRWLTSFFNFLFLTSTLLLASSRNWYLITGKARSWSEGSHWLWEETDLQGVGERWLSRFTQEKTKPFCPLQAPCLRAQQLTHLYHPKGTRSLQRSLQTCFFFSSLTSVGACALQRCWLLCEHLAVPRAGSALPCAGIRAPPGERLAVGQLPMPGTSPSCDTLGTPGLGQEEVPSVYPHSGIPWAPINKIINCLRDKTLAPQEPGLLKTRAYLFIHHLHLIFSMLFSGEKKNQTNHLDKKF